MHPRRKPARVRSRIGSVLVVVLLTIGAAGCSQRDDAANSATTSPDQTQGEFTAKATVAELSPAIAAILDRPLVTPSIETDPSADELASGAAAVAITEGIDATAGTAASYRIVVDPAALEKAGDESSRALLAHEIVHLYLQPVTAASTPLWLVEGIADFVGYRAAGTDLDAVRGGIEAPESAPSDLPADAEFTSEDAHVQATAYAEAWLAMEFLAQTIGDTSAIGLFRAVAASASPQEEIDTQLVTHLGYGRIEFVQQWLLYLDSSL